VRFQLKGENASRLASSPVQYDSGYTLLPGKYVIKFLARNAETGRIGTYQTDFVVPNLNKEMQRLPMSSVVLSSQREAMTDALFNAGKDKKAKEQVANPLIEEGQKLLPSITRVFSKSREMYVYLQAYERDATATATPLIAYVAFFRGDTKVFETMPYIVDQGMKVQTHGVPVPIKLTVPLESLPSGDAVFQVTVLDPTTQKAAFWQAAVKIVP
jgi:hypothetical protein